MPEIIEGEAIIIDDGSSDQQSILSSWLEPLPEAYKARRAWIALGTSILISIFFAYLSWKLYLLHQLLSARGVLTLLGIIAAPAIGIGRWKFWINHPEVRCYAKITPHGPNDSLSLRSWWRRLRTNPISELTPEALTDFQFYEAERRAEFRELWRNRITWLVKMAREPDIRFPIAILILFVDLMLRYNHEISIVGMGSVLLVALLVAYEMLFLLLIYIPFFALLSRYIPYTILVPMSVIFFMGAMLISMVIKAESRS
jgi:hypothetical protein